MAGKQQLKHVSGSDRTQLEQMIERIELQSENYRVRGELVSASDLMLETRYLRMLLPPTSPIHARAWNNGDMFSKGKWEWKPAADEVNPAP